LEIAQSAVVKADARCYLVAAASIVAKVYRDKLMEEYDRQYPQYGFAIHKGYPTKSHIQALNRYGPSPIHRHSFDRVKGGLIS
jgi:ribonuclease HII